MSNEPVNDRDKFTNLQEAFWAFSRNALSDFTPPKTLRSIEGGFYAGAQAMFVLMVEALDLDPTTCTSEVGRLFAECQAFFITAKARVESEQQEKKDGKKRRT